MAEVDDEVETIARRMAELRRELTTEVREVSRGARVMTDWRFYVRRYPLAIAGLAAAVGFLVVPKKKAVISPDQEALAELVRKKQLRLDVDHKQEKPGVVRTLVMLAATAAAKIAMGYVSERMRTVAAEKAHRYAERGVTPTTVH
jgi:hypothetical protein